MGDVGFRAARDSDLARLNKRFAALASTVRDLAERLAALEHTAAAHHLDLRSARQIDEEIADGLKELVEEVSGWRVPKI
jgi:hypothetical protein